MVKAGSSRWSIPLAMPNRDAYTYNSDYLNQITSDGNWDYTYDANGNTTGKEEVGGGITWYYYFDHATQLTEVERRTNGTDVDLEVQFKYDPYGGRIEKSVDDDGIGLNTATVIRFALDGWTTSKPSPIGNEN